MARPCASITDGRLADLLEEIFLRLPTPTDLLRVSAVCVPFRQIVTGRAFLRRFCRSRSPPFIGFIEHGIFRSALPPHSSAPTAGALATAADFSFSFLPYPARWAVRDARDGRVLLSRAPEGRKFPVFIAELAVCDPLHRGYRLLPEIPDDLAASVKDPFEAGFRSYEAILVPLGKEEEDEDDEASFGVIWMAQCRAKPVAFRYSSRTGQWQAIATQGWNRLLDDVEIQLECSMFSFSNCGYAYGCLYWLMRGTECGLLDYPRQVMLVLDTIRLEFSVADYPPGEWRGRSIGIVEAGDGRLGLLAVEIDNGSRLCYVIRQSIGEGSNEWQMERSMPLSAAKQHYIVGATDRYLLIQGSDSRAGHSTECFSLDVKIFRLERVCTKSSAQSVPIYTNFPPSLSSRAV